MSGSARSYEESFIHKSGRRVDIAITKLPIVVDGHTVGIYGIAKDLTAQRALEAPQQRVAPGPLRVFGCPRRLGGRRNNRHGGAVPHVDQPGIHGEALTLVDPCRRRR